MVDNSSNRAPGGRGTMGATLMGVLIGMALGLAIAVAVAVYVTRAPVPFINKQGRVGQSVEAARTSGDPPDPNKPLASKARPAGTTDSSDANSILGILKDAPPVPPGAQTGAPARGERIVERTDVASAASAAAAPPVRIQPAPPPPPPVYTPSRTIESARGGDLSNYPNNVAAAPRPAPPAAAQSSGFLLQAGAFRGQDDADTLKAKLALLGFEARVLPVDVDGRPMFRVRVGPYGQLEDMNRARAKLAENGIEATIVRLR